MAKNTQQVWNKLRNKEQQKLNEVQTKWALGMQAGTRGTKETQGWPGETERTDRKLTNAVKQGKRAGKGLRKWYAKHDTWGENYKIKQEIIQPTTQMRPWHSGAHVRVHRIHCFHAFIVCVESRAKTEHCRVKIKTGLFVDENVFSNCWADFVV